MKHSFLKRFGQLSAGLLLTLVLAILFVSIQDNSDAVQAAPLLQTSAEIEFELSSYAQTEGDSGDAPPQVTIRVHITGTLSSPTATVEYLGVAGTATEGSTQDYTIGGTGVLMFTTSPSDQTFVVTINPDDTFESDEFFTLVLRNPVNATLATNDTVVFEITNDDTTPTSTPTNTPVVTGGPIFVDAYEPNNTLQESYTTSSGTKLCAITLWPTGDLDYFRFVGKAGSYYEVLTTDLEPGVDTALQVFNTQGVRIASNDDFVVSDRRSQVTIGTNVDGYYYARIDNKDPSDPADKTYCFEVREITPPTPTPSKTPIPGDGDCEFNSTIEYACTIGLGQTYSFDFVPVYGSDQDTDMFRLWMKPGIEYTCETTIPTGSFADTNIIFLDQNGNDFQPNLGNDDKEFGDLGSKLSYLSAYTGWLHVMVGPVNVPPYEEAPDHKYNLICTATIATATPTATPTRVFTGGGAPAPVVSTPTPIVFPTFPPTPTPIDLSGLTLGTPVPPTPPTVQFQPLPTAVPAGGGERTSTINVTIYYDANKNFKPELTEGIMDTAVSLFENSSGELIAFGYTNEAGLIRFDSISSVSAIRVVIPFLNYTQIVTGESANILVRVAPQPLPVGIP